MSLVMKPARRCPCALLLCQGLLVWGQAQPDATLKEAAGLTPVSSATAWEGVNGIIKGPNVERNQKLILKHFNAIQPAVYPTWGGFWPQEQPERVEEFSFWIEPLSDQADWAERHGLKVLHHGILAPNYYFPDWWKTTRYTAAELEMLLRKYIEAVVSVKHVDAWNVVNELFLGDGSYFPDGDGGWDNKWLGMGMEPDASGLTGAEKINASHPRFIRIALEHAAAHTEGLLEIREGTTFQNPRKLASLYQLTLHLKNLGAPLHAVGIQAHLDYNGDYDFEAFKATVEKFHNAGVAFFITELDVGLPPGSHPDTADWPQIEAQQAEVYYRIVKTAREASVGWISVWGLTDAPKGSWRGGERALLFDHRAGRKAGYDRFLDALLETKPPNPTPNDP